MASFGMSVLAHGGMLPMRYLVYIPSKIFSIPPEVWRIPTSFLLTGPQFSIFMDPYLSKLFPVGLSLKATDISQSFNMEARWKRSLRVSVRLDRSSSTSSL